MEIYPAIDIKDGNCVRLMQGDFDKVTVYGKDPAEMAKKWAATGAKNLHVVDLDGALAGNGVNENAIGAICDSVSMRVQTGGGIRTMEDISRKIALGVSRVILGTAAVKNETLVRDAVVQYGDKIAVGIDAKDGKVAIAGWKDVCDIDAVAFGKKMASLGVKTFIYTDIATDGMLGGCNVEAMKIMSEQTGANVIASGGVSSIEDIEKLKEAKVYGAIIGKALYTGYIDLEEALKAAEE